MNPTHLDPFAPANSPLHPAYVAPVELPEELKLAYSPEEFAGLAALFPDDEPDGGWQHTAQHEDLIVGLASELDALFGAYGTTDEVAAAQDGQGYPALTDLRQRARDHVAELIAARPAESALKPEWIAYYQLVFNGATEEQAAELTVAELKDKTKLEEPAS